MKTTEVWNALLEKPRELLTTHELNVTRVNVFCVEFMMGGWLYNLSPTSFGTTQWDELRETAKSLAAIGASATADALREIAQIVERADSSRASTWGEFLAKADPHDRIQVLEKAIDCEMENVWEWLVAYTIEHFQCEPD